tara:strand:+ start:3758 stop:3916 length:159 start_codon:yes stop_codon:yes gene_type:complete
MSTKTTEQLVAEASVLAERINRARFEGKVPEACETVALTEILDIVLQQVEAA